MRAVSEKGRVARLPGWDTGKCDGITVQTDRGSTGAHTLLDTAEVQLGQQ